VQAPSAPLSEFGGLAPDHAAYPIPDAHEAPAGRRLGLGVLVFFALALAIFAISTAGRGRIPVPSLMTEIVDAAQLAAGFEIRQVVLTGYRATSVGAILEAAGLAGRTPSLSFDTVTARARIEDLPWVRGARLAVTLPDVLDITISERDPHAVWEEAPGKAYLIDAQGRVLGPVGIGLEAMLPIVTGAGAPSASPSLLALIERHPTVAIRTQKAERVGARRWSLHLSDGSIALLPASEVETAVTRLEAILRDPKGERAGARIIDLRLENTVIERRRDARDVPGARTPVTAGRREGSAP